MTGAHLLMEDSLKILAIRSASPGGGGNVRARFDLETDDGTKIRDLKLVQAKTGWRVYGPQHFGMSIVTFPADVVDRIATEALRHVRTAA